MKRITISIFTVITMVFLSACEKESAEVKQQTSNTTHFSNMMNTSSPPHVNSIVISTSLAGNTPGQIDIKGFFHSYEGDLELVDGLSVGGKNIPGTNVNSHYLHIRSEGDLDHQDNVISDLDNMYDVISGSPLIELNKDGVVQTMTFENPDPIDYSLNASSIWDLPRNTPLEITWNTDEDNVSGKVLIALISRGMDLAESPADSTKNIYFEAITDDDGNFTIPAEELNQFYPGNYIDLLIARGREELMDDNETLVTAVSSNYTLGRMDAEGN